MAQAVKFAVFFDRPFYPSVSDTFDTLGEAIAHAEQLVMDEADEGGEHEATIYVAQVAQLFQFKTTH